ncbi:MULTISPECIES: glycosyltransferase family protein [Bacteroides]|uniref:hypothetical protein n=1 Tax=Bacteroides TaxID=816 RepID=UPI000336F310|nr:MULTISPECIES: hypothetical protein [Bacteroides]UYU46506.1 hypothetical protein KQP70_08450 [Bacteroides salyersiae]CCY49845.1 uncharacterized protein BN523_02193 [Bacteroides sp. CAG:189]
MEEFKLPKVLAISISTWHKDSGIHTQTDLFKYWDPNRVAHIYTRSNYPDTPVCNKFFQIAENGIIRSVLNRKPVGKEVFNGQKAENAADDKAIQSERKLYDYAHKEKNWFLTCVRELVWKLGNWKTKALLDYVKEVNPDVYFIPIYGVAYMAWLQLYVIKKFPRPYVCFITDDNYSYMACGKNPWAWLHRYILRKGVKKLAENCNEIFVITKTEAKDTDDNFGTKSVVLTKGIDYSKLKFDDRKPHTPIKMVYTGNLLIGRAASLIEISKALANINKDGVKVTFDIYTPTILDDEITKILNANGCTKHAPVPKEQVVQIQKDADIVVFVESLEKEHRYDARLSFSTKLTDYFASGKCIFAIGDKIIAPIQYLEEYDCAIVSTDYRQIEGQLRQLIDSPDMIVEYGRKAFETGRMNHEETKVRKTFVETLCKAAKNKR